MPDSSVYIQKVRGGAPGTFAAIEGFFDALPATKRLTSGSRVLIKPNLLAKHPPESAVTTHPEVLRGVILALQRRGVKNITVADSPGGSYTPAGMQATYKTCGIAAVCEELGVSLYTTCESIEVEAANTPGRLVSRFNLIKPVAETDFIINLPKLKTHVMAYMSGATKNLFGCVPGLEKAEFHMRFPEREQFGQMLVDLCETVHADLHIVDGLIAMEGDGPAGGTPRRTDLLFASEDPYMLDLALCRTMGLEPMRAPMLAAAHKAGLCPRALDESLLIGDEEAKTPIESFQKPRGFEGRMDFSSSLPAPLRPIISPFVALAAPKPKILPGCIGCGKCAEICPQQVITIQNKKAQIRYKSCIRCFCCHEMCPVKQIAVRRIGVFKAFSGS